MRLARAMMVFASLCGAIGASQAADQKQCELDEDQRFNTEKYNALTELMQTPGLQTPGSMIAMRRMAEQHCLNILKCIPAGGAGKDRDMLISATFFRCLKLED